MAYSTRSRTRSLGRNVSSEPPLEGQNGPQLNAPIGTSVPMGPRAPVVVNAAASSIISHAASGISPSSAQFRHDGFNPNSTNCRRIIAFFTGENTSVHVDAWLNIFEVVMHGKSEDDKKFLLVQYIDGTALSWFSRHVIPSLQALSWTQIKELMNKRFQRMEVRPIIAAQERYLRRTDTIQEYFNDKMRLMQETNLTALDMVAMLNKGMPASYKPHLICAKPLSPSDWLMIALELESMFKPKKEWTPNRQLKGPTPHSDEPRPLTAHASAYTKPKTTEDKPKTPCKFCKDRGETQYHWHKECPHRPPRPSHRMPHADSRQEPSAPAFVAHGFQEN